MAEENSLGSSLILQGMRDANPELLGEESDPTIAEFLWQNEIVNKGQEENFNKDDFFQNLGTLRNDIGFFDSIGRSISRGWSTTIDSFDVAEKYLGEISGGVLSYKPFEHIATGSGQFTDKQLAERFMGREQDRRRNSPSFNQMQKLQAIVAEDADLWDMVSNAADANLILSLLAESLASYAPTLLAAGVAGAATGGFGAVPILTGAVVGSGMMTGTGLMEYLREEEGVETAEDFEKAFSDPDMMGRAAKSGAKYGVPIGMIDAFSMGIAGNVGRIINTGNRSVRAATRVSKAADKALSKSKGLKKLGKTSAVIGGEAAVQGGLGALGETLGSYWSTGKVNAGEVFLEAIIEPAILPFELAVKSPRAAARLITREKTNEFTKDPQDKIDSPETNMDRRILESAETPIEGQDTIDVQSIINVGPAGVVDKQIIDTQSMDPKVRKQLVRKKILRKVGGKKAGKFEYRFTEKGALIYNEEILPRLQAEAETKYQGSQGQAEAVDVAIDSAVDLEEFEGWRIQNIDDSTGGPTFQARNPKNGQLIRGFTLIDIKAKITDDLANRPLGQQELWDDLDEQRQGDFRGTLERVASIEDSSIEQDVANLTAIDTDKNLSEVERNASLLKYLIDGIREESTTKAGKPKKKFTKAAARRVNALLEMQDNLSGALSEQVAEEPQKGKQLKLNLRKKQKPVKMGPKNRARVETFVNEVEERSNNLAGLRAYLEGTIRDPKITARDPRKMLARSALDRIRSQDAGIQPETVSLTRQQENVLRDTLDKARIDEQLKEVMMAQYGKSHKMRRAARKRFLSEDAADQQLRERIFEAIETDKDTVRKMPDKSRTVATRERSTLELEQAEQLIGTEAWQALVLEEWQKEQARYPSRDTKTTNTQALINAFDRVNSIRRQIYDLNIEVANDIVNETALQDRGVGGNSVRSLSITEQKELLEFIQNMLGRSVSVIFDTVNSMTDTVRRIQAIPENIVVQGYANPLEKTIVLALDRKFSKQIAGEEAFHIAMRIALTEEERGVLEGYDWIDIARQNQIDVSTYPIDIQAFEAVAKVFAKYIDGEKVKGLSPANKSSLGRVKNFLDKLANFVRGKGWKKRYPTPIDIFDSISRGDLANREFHFPVGPVAENFLDLNQEELVSIQSDIKREEKAANHWNTFGLFNRLLEHPSKLAAKVPWMHVTYALIDQMKRFQDKTVHDGLTIMRTYSNASRKDQREVEKFAHLLDFEAQGRNPQQMSEYILDSDNQDSPTIGFQIPLTEDAQELSDLQNKIKKYEFAMGGTINGQKIEPGARIELTEEQTKAYRSYKEGADYRRDMVKQAILIKLGELSEGATTNDLVEKILIVESEFAEVLGTKAEKAVQEELTRLKNARRMIKELDGNPFYMARMRKGTKQIIVREKMFDEDGQEIKGKYGPIQHLEVDSKRTGEFRKTFDKLIDSRAEELRKIWGPKFEVKSQEFSIEETITTALSDAKAGKDFAVVSGLSLMEMIMSDLNVEASDPVKGAFERLKKQLEKKSIEGLGEVRQAQNITGHWNPNVVGYANIVAKKQLHTLSYQLGKIIFDPQLEKEGKYLEVSRKEAADDSSPNFNRDTVRTIEAVQKYLKTYLDFVNDPVNKGAAIRNLVFHMAIGGRMSSAILNWMQLPQALWPLLCAINPGSYGIATPFMIAKNTALLAKAWADANRVAWHAGFKGPITAYNLKLELGMPQKIGVSEMLSLGLRDESEWNLIRELAPQGVLSPINMEDLTDNVNYKELFREGSLKAKSLGTTLSFLSNVSSYMFAYTEFTNRVATALVVHRAARDPQKGAQVRANLDALKNQTYFKDSPRLAPVQLEDNEEGYINAAHIAVVESQYMMGKFNRPQLFYLGGKGGNVLGALLPIATQFMSFPFQYLEMYFKNVRRVTKGKSAAERKIGVQTGVLITLAMIGLAGALGLPFMENIKRLILLFSDLDIEREMRETMVNDLGWGAEATNVIASGALFQYLGFEGSKRAGMGSMVDSSYLQGDVGAVFGPAGGMVEQTFHYVKEGIERGDPVMIARGLIPIGGIKDMFGFVDAAERGIRTRRGNLLIAPEDMTTGEYWTKLIGFYPSRAALRRDLLAYSIQDRNAGQRNRDLTVDRLMLLRRRIGRTGNPSEKLELQEEFDDILYNYNRRASKNRWRPITTSLLGRRILAEVNPTAAQLKTMPVAARRDFLTSARMLKVLEEGLGK